MISKNILQVTHPAQSLMDREGSQTDLLMVITGKLLEVFEEAGRGSKVGHTVEDVSHLGLYQLL